MRKSILTLALFAIAAISIAGCGAAGGSGGGGNQQDITVTLSPKTASVAGGGTQLITATILNPHNTGVIWTLSGSGCTGSACGTLGSYGGNSNQGWTATYTAPLTVPNPATVAVTATSLDDNTKSDIATITVIAPVVTVAVTPKTPTVILGATQQLTATVRGSTNTSVTWSTPGPGTVNSSGLYSAPATLTTPATATVTATSQADNTKSDFATITIPAVTVNVTPQVSTVILGATQQFAAAVGNAANTGVTWTLSGPGTLSSSGLYSAPGMLATPATASVKATSLADPTKSMTITFNIPAVTVVVLPKTATVILGDTKQFTATVTNAMNILVTWTVTGPGSINSYGLYSAPTTLTTPATATVTATSVADPSKSDTDTVTIPAVEVSIDPTTASLDGGDTQQFTATVTNAMNHAVTWKVTGLGTISSQGLYSAPALVPSQTTATITATSVADPTKSASATVTLIPISVTVSPATAMVAITGKKQFTANVQATSNTAVTWSVSGTGCSGDDCGKISSTGRFVAPAAVPSSTVAVKVTSVADPTKYGTAYVQVMPNGNFKLNGNYAMYFQGFDPTGKMLATVGTIIADGNGNLTGGIYEGNGLSVTGGAHYLGAGTYTIGGDNRGILARSLGDTYRFAISDDGDRGYFIEWDNSGVRGSGVFKKQTATDFSISKITGDYAFGFSGSDNNGNRQGSVGRFTSNGAGILTQGASDTVGAVTGHTQVTSYTGTIVFDASTGGPTYGRGTMTTTIPSVGTFHATFYVVNATEFFYISTDPISATASLLTGTILAQSTPFSVSSLNGPGVFHLTGMNPAMNLNNIMIGQWVANSGTGTLAAEYAGNDAGSTIPQGSFSASYSIATNGRGSLVSSLGTDYFYMVAPNQAFLVSSDANVMTGTFEPQLILAGGFTNASVAGDYFLGTVDRASPSVIDASGVANFDGSDTWTSMEDASLPSGNYSDQARTASYSVTSSTTGKILITVPGGNEIVFYAVSPTKLYNFVLYTPDRIAESEQQ